MEYIAPSEYMVREGGRGGGGRGRGGREGGKQRGKYRCLHLVASGRRERERGEDNVVIPTIHDPV